MEHLTIDEYHALTRKRGNKYNARKVEYDGHTFDSQAEMRRYVELSILQAAGEIRDLELQPKFVLQKAFTDNDGRKYRAITYTADFAYRDAMGHRIVEDVKGKATMTAAFRIKWKWVIKKYHNLNCQFRIVEA